MPARHHTAPDPFGLLLGTIYDTARDPALWGRALEEVADHLGAIGALLVRHAPRPAESGQIQARLDPRLSDLYMNRYPDNPYARALARVPPGHPVICGGLPAHDMVRGSAFEADILVPQRIVEIVALTYGPWCAPPGGSGGISFKLDARRAASAREVTRRFARIAPHLTRALDLGQSLAARGTADAALGRLLDLQPNAAMALDRRGRVLRANAAGEALLRSSDGIAAPVRVGRLAAILPEEDRALSRLVAAAHATARGEGESAGGRLRISRPSGAAPLLVLVSPLPAPRAPFGTEEEPAVLVVVHDPEAPTDAAALGEAFGLTAAEARLAALVASGVGLPDAAARLGVSRETARTHLARCFDKTGARSQAALARLSAALPRREAASDPES